MPQGIAQMPLFRGFFCPWIPDSSRLVHIARWHSFPTRCVQLKGRGCIPSRVLAQGWHFLQTGPFHPTWGKQKAVDVFSKIKNFLTVSVPEIERLFDAVSSSPGLHI